MNLVKGETTSMLLPTASLLALWSKQVILFIFLVEKIQGHQITLRQALKKQSKPQATEYSTVNTEAKMN